MKQKHPATTSDYPGFPPPKTSPPKTIISFHVNHPSLSSSRYYISYLYTVKTPCFCWSCPSRWVPSTGHVALSVPGLKDPEPDPKRRRVQLQEPIVRHSGIWGRHPAGWDFHIGFPAGPGEDIKTSHMTDGGSSHDLDQWLITHGDFFRKFPP